MAKEQLKTIPILKKHKNTLLTIVQESDLDPALFAAEQQTIDNIEFFTIQLRNSPIRFAVRSSFHSFDIFYCRHSFYIPELPLSPEDAIHGAESLHIEFRKWLDNVVKPYLEELGTSDLWQMLENTTSHVMNETEAPSSFEPFSEDEKIQLRLSINEFRILIKNNFNPNKEELAAINDRLKYLTDAIDKRNKFDWKGIAIQTVITIVVTLALNPEQSKQLFQLFKQVFAHILYLP